MTPIARFALGAAAVSGAVLAAWPGVLAQVPADPPRSAFAAAQEQAARARDRAAQLDRAAQDAARAGAQAEARGAALAAQVQQAEARLETLERRTAKIAQDRRALAAELARERAPAARLMAGLGTYARRPTMLTLVQPGSVQDMVHMRAILAAVEPQIAARTAGLRSRLARASALEAETGRIAGRERAQRAALDKQRAALASLAASEALKARRAAGSADREAERAYALARQAGGIGTFVRRVGQGRAAAATPARGGPPSYRLPVDGRQIGGAEAETLTIAARPAGQVVAPAAGRIAFAGPYRGYGSIVIIEHDGGWTSLVTGMESAQVAIGQSVGDGAPIGRAPLRAPQISLELRRGAQRVDPLAYMR